jgi:hypothetical protein
MLDDRRASAALGLPLLCGLSRRFAVVVTEQEMSCGTGSSCRKSELRMIFQHFDRDNVEPSLTYAR